MRRYDVVVATLEPEETQVTLRNFRRVVLRGLLVGVLLAALPLLGMQVTASMCVFIAAQAVIPASCAEFWAATQITQGSARAGLQAVAVIFLTAGAGLSLTLLQSLYALNAIGGGGVETHPSVVLLGVLRDPEVLLDGFLLILPLAWLIAVASYGHLRGSFTEDGARLDALALCLASGAVVMLLGLLIGLPVCAMNGSLWAFLMVVPLAAVAGGIVVVLVYIGSGLLYNAYRWADSVEELLCPRVL